jgi:hypothetical protein
MLMGSPQLVEQSPFADLLDQTMDMVIQVPELTITSAIGATLRTVCSLS